MASGKIAVKHHALMYEPCIKVNALPSRYYKKTNVAVNNKTYATVAFGDDHYIDGTTAVFCGIYINHGSLTPFRILSKDLHMGYTLRNNSSSDLSGRTMRVTLSYIYNDDCVTL